MMAGDIAKATGEVAEPKRKSVFGYASCLAVLSVAWFAASAPALAGDRATIAVMIAAAAIGSRVFLSFMALSCGNWLGGTVIQRPAT